MITEFNKFFCQQSTHLKIKNKLSGEYNKNKIFLYIILE